LFERALKQHPASMELKLRLIDELVTLGKTAMAEEMLASVQKEAPNDWRVAWYKGRALLAQGYVTETLQVFQAILDELPGELAPRQALARTHEEAGNLADAIAYYDAVSRADSSFVSAAIGLGRCLEKKGDKDGAAAAYRRVPPTSSRYAQAQMALARVLIHTGNPTVDELVQAGTALESLEGLAEGIDVHVLRAELFATAAKVANASNSGSPATILKVPLEGVALQRAAEHEYRTCARIAATKDERYKFVDQANLVRPLTLV
jgi:serine/threonine-protein kinase PknG